MVQYFTTTPIISAFMMLLLHLPLKISLKYSLFLNNNHHNSLESQSQPTTTNKTAVHHNTHNLLHTQPTATSQTTFSFQISSKSNNNSINYLSKSVNPLKLSRNIPLMNSHKETKNTNSHSMKLLVLLVHALCL